VTDDALAVGQHLVLARRGRQEAALAHAGDHIGGVQAAVMHQVLVEDEDAAGVVIHHGLDRVQDVLHDLVQVEGVAHLL